MTDALGPWLRRWDLTPDGAVIRTATSLLRPVRTPDDRAAMLKLAQAPEEAFGNGLMVWWAGDGAAEVLASEGPALLMARAPGGELLALFLAGHEAEATAALALCLSRLHRPRPNPPQAIPMERRLAALFQAASNGAPFAGAAVIARRLLAEGGAVLLHGDAHPANVLDFGHGDWRAIDPKRVSGPPAYDHVAVLVTPDLSAEAARLDRQLALTAAASGLPQDDLLAWALVSASLSAAWSIEDGDDPAHGLAVADWASARLSPTG